MAKGDVRRTFKVRRTFMDVAVRRERVEAARLFYIRPALFLEAGQDMAALFLYFRPRLPSVNGQYFRPG